MRIGDAVYTLSTIRRSNRTPRTPDRSARSSAEEQPTAEDAAIGTLSRSAPADRTVPVRTFADMLHDHFVGEVRARDRDGDGLLSRQEYAGTPTEFDLLDSNADGLVGAADLVRGALGRSPDLSQIVAGPWAPIYNAILNSPSKDQASLEEAVRAGAEEVAGEEGTSSADVQPNPTESFIASFGVEAADSTATSAVDDLMSQFLDRYDQLGDLRAKLDDLADRLGRSPQYHHIDHTA
jgi:hypothetical protein